MAETNFNNNGETIDASLDALGLRPAPLPTPIEDPIATGPFEPSAIVVRLNSIEHRLTVLETKEPS